MIVLWRVLGMSVKHAAGAPVDGALLMDIEGLNGAQADRVWGGDFWRCGDYLVPLHYKREERYIAGWSSGSSLGS